MTRACFHLTLLGMLVALPPHALAQAVDPALTGAAVKGAKLTERSDYSAEAIIAGVLEAQRKNVVLCYEGEQPEPAWWAPVFALGTAFRQQRDALEAARKQAVEDAKASLDAAQQAFDALVARVNAGDAAAPALIERANTQLAAASAAHQRALAGDDALYAKTSTARDAFASKLATVENAVRSPARFREAVRDAKRRGACIAIGDALDAAFARTHVAPPAQASGEQREAENAQVEARINDTIGKTTGVASAVSGTSNALEQPGAPERMVYTIMSALGADSETTGTQLLMTLNLASVGAADSAEPVESPFLRNLFLRVGLPLESTAGDPAAPAVVPESEEDGAGAMPTPDVSRLSFVLGGSLADESDPRLPDHDECFEVARNYVPFALDAEEDARRIREERQLYYGICAQVAANRERLAWRAGLGLITTREDDRDKTKPELMALALVYGPADWLLFNVIAQRVLEPHVVNTLGGGLSLYVDAGGQTPGSQWARAAIDTLILAELREADEQAGIEKSTGWEARVSLSASGKVATGGIAQVSLGPRILSSGTVGLFTTVALTYDADQLINTLLTPPEPQAR